MSEIKWGFIGTGGIAAKLAEALRHIPGANLYAVASRTDASAAAFARTWDVPKAYGTYEALLQDPDVDLVYIAIPTGMHKSIALAALRAGKSALCEKSLTTCEADSKKVLDFAKSKNLFFMEAMWTAFFPAFDRLQTLLKSGEIGTLTSMRANFTAEITPQSKPALYDPTLGGGATHDLGIYPIMAALTFAGPAQDVKADVTWGATGVDERVQIESRHTNGVTSTLRYGFAPTEPFALELIGSEGRILVEDNFFFPRDIKIETPDGTRTETLDFIGNGYVHEVLEVHHCLSQGHLESSIWSHERTLACARIMDWVLERA